MNFNFTVGQQLLVTLTNGELYEGQYCSGSKTRIDLFEVREHSSGNKLPGMLCFYKSEIDAVTEFSESDSSSATPEQVVKQMKTKCTIAMPREEYENLKKLAANYLYMATMDRRYVEITDCLLNYETVGVVAIGSERGRENSISLLVLSTWDKIYLFDILQFMQLGKTEFPVELKEILESKDIQKVVHNSRTLVDCLYHRYKVNLTNIFDTQVADIVVLKKEGKTSTKVRDLSECLNYHLNFPLSLLEKSLNTPLEKWSKRPLKDTRKVRASLLGTYLITLKNYLEGILLKELYEMVDCYSSDLKSLSLCNASKSVNCLELPAQIKKLL